MPPERRTTRSQKTNRMQTRSQRRGTGDVFFMNLDRPSMPASQKIWHIAELVMLILPHLARERIDLIAFSQVSKALRTMALPFLVRTLDLSITRLDPYQNFFNKHPELTRHVRWVRIVDDYATTGFRHREHSRPKVSGSLPSLAARLAYRQLQPDGISEDWDAQWLQLRYMIKDRWPHAKYDLTAGASSVAGVMLALMQTEIIGNIVAMRWIADLQKRIQMDEWDHDWYHRQYIRSLDSQHWETVNSLIQDVIEIQADSGDSGSKLVSLQISEHHYDRPTESDPMGSLWELFDYFDSDNLHTFSIDLSDQCNADTNESIVFSYEWSGLRRFSFHVGPEQMDNAIIATNDEEFSIDAWLDDHNDLEHIDIYSWDDIPPFDIVQSLLDDSKLPKLKSISFRGYEPGPVGAFLMQHGPKLVELELPRFTTGGGQSAAIIPNLGLPKLRVLRAPPRAAAAMFDGRHAPQLAHIEFTPVQIHQELMLDEWICPGSAAASSITCLDIELKGEYLVHALKEMRRILNAERFPSLAELSLCSTLSYEDEYVHDGDKYLEDILERLRKLPSLRALRIEDMGVEPFPDNETKRFKPGKVPPKLEYLTWHSPKSNITQYFRIANVFAHVQVVRREQIRMQRLPASFRAHISEEGEWIQPARLRHGNIIFDHTVTPPRLPFQA
ncbi:hypothetical protein OC846_005397 [Tilletia horrida]|uniref:Uncharacterized protein n=1 Tax=Tilletia horrida TaxID=155126 RepID=A0AAN6JQ95_9BASI|nr:hypothetical protein OC846_005397 [Tilletia horrida]KAK0561838.1 hypothetical protein OC861_005629 [Tilletia horrida]